MWTMIACLAQASDPPPSLDELDWRIQDEAHWRAIDVRATRTARMGAVLGTVGPLGVGVGAGLIGYALNGDAANSVVAIPGGLLVLGGAGGMLVGPPMAFAGAARANAAMRRQGVVVSTASAIGGGVLIGATIVTTAVADSGRTLVAGVGYTALMAAAWGQIEVNRVGRLRSGLEPASRLPVAVVPIGRGFAVVGGF